MIYIDVRDSRPIYEQIVEKTRMLILRGVIRKDEKLPSVRNMAVELSINPNTIQRAYGELERLGYIYTVKGKGNFASGKESLLMEYRKELLDRITQTSELAFSIGVTEKELTEAVLAAEGRARDDRDQKYQQVV